jgi:hypothetical protein
MVDLAVTDGFRFIYLCVSLCIEGILIIILVFLCKDLKGEKSKFYLPAGICIEKDSDKTTYTFKYQKKCL